MKTVYYGKLKRIVLETDATRTYLSRVEAETLIGKLQEAVNEMKEDEGHDDGRGTE